MDHRPVVTTLLALGALAFTGCRGDRQIEVIELAPPPSPTATVAVEAPETAPDAAEPQPEPTPEVVPPAHDRPAWSATPPHDGGMEFQLERLADGRLRLTREQIAIELNVPRMGGCTEEFSQIQHPDLMPESRIRERPTWLALVGQDEAASIRLSTRGALLVIDDGCQRAADVTEQLLGTMPTSADPIFAASPVAPEGAYDADDVRLKRRGPTKALILYDNEPFIDVSFFNGESMLTASALDDQRWISLLMTREWEYADNDGAVGREHTLVWTPREGDRPLLVFDNDYRYGMDGLAREEADVKSIRVHPHDGGMLRASGVRRHVYIQNAGRDLCREVEHAFAFRHYDESVEWTITTPDARKSMKLGTAKTRATFAGGCIEVAEKQLKKRREQLTKRAPNAVVKWHSTAGAGL